MTTYASSAWKRRREMKQKDWKSQETMFWKIKPETQRRWMQDTRSPKQSCLVQKKLIPKRVFITKYFLNDICEKKSKASMKVEKKVAARWSKKDETWMKDATDPPTIWSLLFIFVFLCWSSRIQRNIVQLYATPNPPTSVLVWSVLNHTAEHWTLKGGCRETRSQTSFLCSLHLLDIQRCILVVYGV